MDPISIAIAIGIMIVSALLTTLLIKPNKVKPASLEDFDMPTHEDGTPECVLFGDGWVTGAMICWYGNLRTTKIKSDGKK